MSDSSPVALPPVPRPLKRSASVASLPTPPRTRHRTGKRRGRSRGSLESDSDHSGRAVSESSGEEESREKGSGTDENVHKRRRTTDTLEDEEAFWLGEPAAGVNKSIHVFQGSRTKEEGRGRATLGSFRARIAAPDPEPKTARQDIPLVYRRLQKQREHSTSAEVASTSVAPVSPPPSRRKPAPSSTPTLVGPSSPPVTPTKAKKGKKRTTQIGQVLPVRDSPNNPFLDSPSGEGKPSVIKTPRTPPPYEEKSTITYVFRGVRGVYPNPLYNHAKQRPLSPPPQSLLPPEHPDYSPDMRCPPRLLFNRPSHSRHSSDSSHESQSQDELPTTPTRPKNRPVLQ